VQRDEVPEQVREGKKNVDTSLDDHLVWGGGGPKKKKKRNSSRGKDDWGPSSDSGL